MNTTFHKRCVSALTHPATLAAPIVLLVNELLLKPLWSNHWTTGKLSELAWMIFAPPLLAFGLSVLVGQRLSWQRMAFLVAYVGLPVLYIAFNTFEPVHQLTLRLLSLPGESVQSSSLDYSYSLTVPFSLGIALWVWTRSKDHPINLRLSLGILTACVAIFASASGLQPPSLLVGQTSDGTLVMDVSRLGSDISVDGGLTWRPAFRLKTWVGPGETGLVHLTEEDWPDNGAEVQWGSEGVETPRGKYVIQDEHVVRIVGYTEELVYTPAYLQNGADVRFQEYVDRHYDVPYGNPSSLPRNMVYHASSGNIVVSVGTHGVAIGDSNGNWRQINVDWTKPTDFSSINKLRVVFREDGVWFVMVAATLAISAVALALASPKVDIYFEDMRPKIGCLSGVAAVLLMSILTFVLLRDEFSGSELQGATAVLLPLVITLTPLAVLALWLQRGRIIGLGSVAYSIIAAILALLVLPAVSSGLDPSEHLGMESVAGLCIGVSLFYGVVALIVFRPTRGQLSSVLTAMIAIFALVALAFAIGIVQGFDIGLIKPIAVVAVLMAAFSLRWHLRHQLHPS